jgi:ribosomal protein S18 acetylase RimI-like enzyme
MNETAIGVLPATAADVDAIGPLCRMVHELHLQRAPYFFRDPTDEELAAALRDLLSQEGAFAFIAYAGNSPVGYVLGSAHERPENAYAFARRWLHIDQIAVAPAWRGRGVGRALIAAVRDLAAAAGIADLGADTWAFNEPAQAFFRSLGFRPRIIRWSLPGDEPPPDGLPSP